MDALDTARVTRFQWKIMFVSGMGFFTDAYDLFVIGIVVVLLKTEWHLPTSQISLLSSASLAAPGQEAGAARARQTRPSPQVLASSPGGYP